MVTHYVSSFYYIPCYVLQYLQNYIYVLKLHIFEMGTGFKEEHICNEI